MKSSASSTKELRVAALATGAWLVVILLLWLTTRGLEDRWSFGIFLGRFHILAVHLPIGFLVGAFAVELFRRVPVLKNYAEGGATMLWLALFGGIAATILGFTLMVADDFQGTYMTWHMWTGLGVILLTGISLTLHLLGVNRNAYLGTLAANVVLTSISSHYGGNMVHGPEYLGEFAPGPLAPLLGHQAKEDTTAGVPLQGRLIYQDVLQPIFDEKCVECHYEGKVKGKLRMDSFEQLAKGGDIGEEFIPGDAEASELHFRVTLPPDDDDFMPPEDSTEPMTPGEIAIMAWWINEGASPTMTIGEGNPDEEILAHLEAFFASAKDRSPKPKETEEAEEASRNSSPQSAEAQFAFSPASTQG